MDKSKKWLVVITIILIVLLVGLAKLSYFFGQHTSSLTVKEVTPVDLARAMQSDNFYGEYPETMLLVEGTVDSVSYQGNNTLVNFEVAASPSALPKVYCEFSAREDIRPGQNIKVLSVANGAQRQNVADVELQSCYLLKD